MKDQVSGLQQKGIKAAMLCDETDAEEVKEVSQHVSDGVITAAFLRLRDSSQWGILRSASYTSRPRRCFRRNTKTRW